MSDRASEDIDADIEQDSGSMDDGSLSDGSDGGPPAGSAPAAKRQKLDQPGHHPTVDVLHGLGDGIDHTQEADASLLQLEARPPTAPPTVWWQRSSLLPPADADAAINLPCR